MSDGSTSDVAQSRQSAGRRVFSRETMSRLYDLLCMETLKCARSVRSHDKDFYRAFLFVTLLLIWTGKRISEIVALTRTQFEEILLCGVIAIRIRKTKKIGRLETPELIGGRDDDACERHNEWDDHSEDLHDESDEGSIRRSVSPRKLAAIFHYWIRTGVLTLPVPWPRTRRYFDFHITTVYSMATNGQSRPLGLSFHAFRRAFAGYAYTRGVSLKRLQRALDHATIEQTNHYVNACLYDLSSGRVASDEALIRNVETS